MLLPVTNGKPRENWENDMFGGLAAGFAHLVKPSKSAQGKASDSGRA